jgi:hypothetical protein
MKDLDEMTDEELAAARGDVSDVDVDDEVKASADEEETEDGVQQAEGADEEAAEETVEASGEEEDEEATSKEYMIPKSRYDTQAQRNRELQARIAELEAHQQTQQTEKQRQEQQNEFEAKEARIDELEVQINEAILDADAKTAAALRKEQRQLENDLFESRISQASQETTTVAREQARLDLTIDQLETTVPQLNPNSGDVYDKQLVREIQEMRAGYEALGSYTPTEALLKAVNNFIDFNPADLEAAPESQPEGERKGKALKKAVSAAKKQPPKTSDNGDDSDKAGIRDDIDPRGLSLKDLDNLPEDTLRRLRGDFRV